MKKVGLGILIGIIALTFSGVIVIAKAIAPQEKGKANAPDLEKIEFIHYKKNFAKPAAGKAPKQSSCYKFLPGKVRWQTSNIGYLINPANSNLPQDFICSAIKASAETWDNPTFKELFQGYPAGCGIEYTPKYGDSDGKNAITFGNYPDPNVIAVTTVWYNPAIKAIVEFDMKFNTGSDWTWGSCLGSEVDCHNNKVMDLQNIATHELGHGVGLSDVYETNCSEVTMYGYSTEGETDKRILETPDITGLRILYP